MRSKPNTYGQWWNTNGLGVDWYETIHRDLAYVHKAFLLWAAERRTLSFLEVGCGRSQYASILNSYTGCDISEKEIAWCRDQYPHDFFCGDFIELAPDLEKHDVVFSHAVLDHIYDVEAFIKASWTVSKKWIYHSAYSGWFPDLSDHEYCWTEDQTCFYNKIAPFQIVELLRQLGASEVIVKPVETVGRPNVLHDTLIIARKS